LPESGPQLANAIYEMAENICVLNAQGVLPEEIARHAFVKNT
jgi:hypothetical protein